MPCKALLDIEALIVMTDDHATKWKLNQHKIVSLSVLLTICDKLECDISDICEAVSDI